MPDEQNDKNATKNYDYSLYLSYALLDKKIVKKTADFFRAVNKNIKVDMMEKTMSEKVSINTSRTVKNKIIKNDKFVFLATSTSIFSKWINWELGIADCYKANEDKILILPIADKDTRWLGDVYFKLYPRIERIEHNRSVRATDFFRVVYPNGSTKPLQDWLLA
jgi:hypothetical protein